MTPLKLIALDEEDLQVLSCHLQDAVLRVGDMAYLPSSNRFAAVLNRFDWEAAQQKKGENRRRRAALRFDRVFGAKLKGIDPRAADQVLSLLAIRFEEGEKPSGTIELAFSGDVTIRLEAECLEAELADLGPVWETANRPKHPEGDSEMES